MIDAQTEAVLQQVLQTESRSLLSYMADAYPWAAAHGEPALAALRAVVRDEAAAVNALGRYLVRRRVAPPPLPSYPSDFTTHNFISLEYLLPRLSEAARSSVGALERAAAGLHHAEARAEVEKLLAAKRANLTALQQLDAARPQTAGA